MIEVSEKFKNAVRQNTRKYEWYGSITTKAGKVHEFTAKDIVKGSGYIKWQCCSNTEIELGTVYAAEIGNQPVFGDRPLHSGRCRGTALLPSDTCGRDNGVPSQWGIYEGCKAQQIIFFIISYFFSGMFLYICLCKKENIKENKKEDEKIKYCENVETVLF